LNGRRLGGLATNLDLCLDQEAVRTVGDLVNPTLRSVSVFDSNELLKTEAVRHTGEHVVGIVTEGFARIEVDQDDGEVSRDWLDRLHEVDVDRNPTLIPRRTFATRRRDHNPPTVAARVAAELWGEMLLFLFVAVEFAHWEPPGPVPFDPLQSAGCREEHNIAVGSTGQHSAVG